MAKKKGSQVLNADRNDTNVPSLMGAGVEGGVAVGVGGVVRADDLL